MLDGLVQQTSVSVCAPTGPPGPDRVVMDDACRFAGVIVHPPNSNSFDLCDRV